MGTQDGPALALYRLHPYGSGDAEHVVPRGHLAVCRYPVEEDTTAPRTRYHAAIAWSDHPVRLTPRVIYDEMIPGLPGEELTIDVAALKAVRWATLPYDPDIESVRRWLPGQRGLWQVWFNTHGAAVRSLAYSESAERLATLEHLRMPDPLTV